MKEKRSTSVPDQERLRTVLRETGNLFLTRGYEGVSLEMIVAKVGGSFRDLYREFGSKEKLFVRVVYSLCDEVISELNSAGDVRQGELLPLKDVLLVLGRTILAMLLSPRLLELHRLILSEAKRFPELGRRWYEEGPNQANRVVAEVLMRYSKAGLLNEEDPCLLAAVFLDSLINNLQLRKLTGIPVSDADVDERVRVCVRVFMDGVRTPGQLP